MVLANSQGVFNLIDTNGRRSDLINGYSIYSHALYELGIVDNPEHRSTQRFQNYPRSLNQYYFYQKAFENSEVFKKNHYYDAFLHTLDTDADFRDKFYRREPDKRIKKALGGIEDRARHYMNTLRNIGFSNYDNLLTENGQSFVENRIIRRDTFEEELFTGNLPDINLMILRQALKLKVFEYLPGDGQGKKDLAKPQFQSPRYFYSPVKFAIYLLLRLDNRPIAKQDLTRILQNVNPLTVTKFAPDELVDIYDKYGLDTFIDKINLTDYDEQARRTLARYQDTKLSPEVFAKYFTNQNSSKINEAYWEFYSALYDTVQKRDVASVHHLMQVHRAYRGNLKSAFGFDKTVLKNRYTPDFASLVEHNPDFSILRAQPTDFNVDFYKLFLSSKRHDRLRESLTGIFQIIDASKFFDISNTGQIRLRYFEVFQQPELVQHLKATIFGKMSPATWEGSDDSDFFRQTTLMDIFGIDKEQVHTILERTIDEMPNIHNIAELREYYTHREVHGFQKFVRSHFPPQKVFHLLHLFSKRDGNHRVDDDIRANVFSDKKKAKTDIPTMFEYIVGIAWYYLNDKDTPYDLYNSFRLKMGADYLPLTHAAGGDGDLLIQYHNLDLLIEVTLMNEQSQKRGESEPVHRHSVNLNTESDKPHQVTLFVANRLDFNTINGWRSMADTPMQESREPRRFTQGKVRIMPITSEEMMDFDWDGFSSKHFIDDIFRSFENVQVKDTQWREKVVRDSMPSKQ